MRRTTSCAAAVLAAALAARADDGGAAATGRPSPEAGFAALQQAGLSGDAEALKKLYPESVVRDWSTLAKDKGVAWRRDFAENLSKVTLTSSRTSGDTALVRWFWGMPQATHELPLAWDGERWRVDAPWPYCVGGGALSAANAAGRATVKLTARTKPGPYGTSAFSFTHVTQDPAQCGNRMEVWYCHNGDLHFSRGVVAAATDRKDVTEFDGIPTDLVWKGTHPARRGTVFALHCVHADRMDYYAAMKVLSATGATCEFEWRLVAAGAAAPKSIAKPQPLVSEDGPDGDDGLCGKGR